MCGIVGYIGNEETCPILLDGLERLSYRGYDSAGVAVLNKDGKLHMSPKPGGGWKTSTTLLESKPVVRPISVSGIRAGQHTGSPTT